MLIGELAQHSGVSARMLRHYDKLGLVSPTGRTSGGYREYSDSDIRRLFQVECLRSLGLSLRELQDVLEDSAAAPAELVGRLIAHTEDRIEQEKELLKRLRQVEGSAPDDWTDVLHIVSILRGLDSDNPSRRQQSALDIDSGLTESFLAEAVLEEGNANVAGALHWALQRSGGEAVGVLGRALDSSDPAQWQRAISAIAKIDSDESTRLLIDALNHIDDNVRARAAIELGLRGHIEAIPVLFDLIVGGERDVEAAEALGTLARTHELIDATATQAVELIDREDTDPAARLRLTQALAEFPSEVTDLALARLSKDADEPVRLTAAYLLELLG